MSKERFYILISTDEETNITTCKLADKFDVIDCMFTEYIDDTDYSIVIGSATLIEKSDMFYAGVVIGAELAERNQS